MLNIRIVLVEPAGALNVGAIARVMKNMGLTELWLVNPQFDLTTDRYAKAAQDMAVRAGDILSSAKIVDHLSQALTDCHRAIATTGRPELVTETPEMGLGWLMELNNTDNTIHNPVYSGAIVFGREDRGLTNVELSYCQKIIQIPVSAAYPSINLAQAVAICCYQVRLLSLSPSISPSINAPSDLTSNFSPNLQNQNQNLDQIATIAHLEAYYQDLEAVLIKIGYLFPHTAVPRMQKFRHLFNKANLTQTEVNMLRGIIRQINWVSEQNI
jgi:tRNA/rRNA methyltransferase